MNKTEVACAREIRLKEIQMWTIVNGTLMNLGFLILLYSLVYSNHFSNFFYQVDHLRKYLTNSRQIDANFSKVDFLLLYIFYENLQLFVDFNDRRLLELAGK